MTPTFRSFGPISDGFKANAVVIEGDEVNSEAIEGGKVNSDCDPQVNSNIKIQNPNSANNESGHNKNNTSVDCSANIDINSANVKNQNQDYLPFTSSSSPLYSSSSSPLTSSSFRDSGVASLPSGDTDNALLYSSSSSSLPSDNALLGKFISTFILHRHSFWIIVRTKVVQSHEFDMEA